MKKEFKFNKWKKYQVLKKKRDLQKQANIYFKLTHEMLQDYKNKQEDQNNGGKN